MSTAKPTAAEAKHLGPVLVPIARLDVPGTGAFVLRDSHLFVAAEDHGLVVIDVGDPRAPRIAGTTARRQVSNGSPIAVVDDRAYLGEGETLGIYDVADPARPKRLAGVKLGGDVRAIASVPGRELVVATFGGLRVCNRDGAILASVDDAARVGGVAAEGSRVYATADGELRAFEHAPGTLSPRSRTKVGKAKDAYFGRVEMLGEHVLLTYGHVEWALVSTATDTVVYRGKGPTTHPTNLAWFGERGLLFHGLNGCFGFAADGKPPVLLFQLFVERAGDWRVGYREVREQLEREGRAFEAGVQWCATDGRYVFLLSDSSRRPPSIRIHELDRQRLAAVTGQTPTAYLRKQFA